MDFDATQAINLSDFEEDTQDEDEGNKKVLGYLKVFSNRGFDEKVFPVYEGDNYIGREEKNEITIPVKSLSKQHACIEVQADTHLIHDLGSRNKSRKGKLFLKPNVRYNIQHDEKFILADMSCQYYYASQYKNPDENNSGSDTDSELMLEAVDSDPALLLPQSDKERDVSADSDGLDISDCIQPTQAAHEDISPQKNKTLRMKTPAAPRARGVLAAESDDEVNDKKDAADVSRVEDSDSDTDVDVYDQDTEDFTVASDDLAVAPTQACIPHDPAPTQPVKKTKATLSFDPGSDSDEDDMAIAPTQACAPTQPAVRTKTKKTLSFAPESDSESDSNDGRGRSLFEAATQAVPGGQSDSDQDDDDDDDRGASLYEAATQALHYSDSADETVSNNKRVSIASTVMLNESSDLESSTKKLSPGISPTKMSMLKASKSTPARKDSLEASFVFEKPAEKKKLQDISQDQGDSESTEMDVSSDKVPFTNDEKDETLPCSEDDFMAETQDISDFEELQKHSIQDQNETKKADGEAEDKIKPGKPKDKVSVHPAIDQPEGEIETETLLPYSGAAKGRNGVDPTVPDDLQRTLSEKSKDSDPQSVEGDGMSVPPTVPYQLCMESTNLSSGSVDNPLETVVEPIGEGKTIAGGGGSNSMEEGGNDIEETQAYTGVDPEEMETVSGLDGRQSENKNTVTEEVEAAETQAYGIDSEVPEEKEGSKVGLANIEKGKVALSVGSPLGNQAESETLTYGMDVDDAEKPHDMGGENGREGRHIGDDVGAGETQAYGADVGTHTTKADGGSGGDKICGDTQAYGVELEGVGTKDTSAGETVVEETQAYGLDEEDINDPSRMRKGMRQDCSDNKGQALEDAFGRVEETQAHPGEEEFAKPESRKQPNGDQIRKDEQLPVEETQAYGMEEPGIGSPELGISGKNTRSTDDSGHDAGKVQRESEEVEETQAYGSVGALTGSPDEGTAGPGDLMEVGATQPYGQDDGLNGGGTDEGKAGQMEVEETQAYGTEGGTVPTMAYGDEEGETQVPDSQEMEVMPEEEAKDPQKDDVFAGGVGNSAEGTDNPDMVEVDAAPLRRKSGDEGLLKKRRSSQNLKDMDKPDKGGLLSSLKKKVHFGKKKKKSTGSQSGGSTGSSRSSSRSSRSSTGSKDGEEAGIDTELGESESVSLLEDTVLEENESDTEPAPPKKRRIATIERPDLEMVERSGRKESGYQEKGEIDEKDSEKVRSDSKRSARQRRNATVDGPEQSKLTTPEREDASTSGMSRDSPDGPPAMEVKTDANNNRRGKRKTRRKVTERNDVMASEDTSGRSEKGGNKRGTRAKAEEPATGDKTVPGRVTRRGQTAGNKKDGAVSMLNETERIKAGKQLVVELEPMEEDEDGKLSPRKKRGMSSNGNQSPDSSPVTSGQTTIGEMGEIKDVSATPDLDIDSTVDVPVQRGGRSQKTEVKDDSREYMSTPEKSRKRTKKEESEVPVRKSSRKGELDLEGGTLSGESSTVEKRKLGKSSKSPEESESNEHTVTSTTSVVSTRGAKKRGASKESEDTSVQESLPRSRSSRNKNSVKTAENKTDVDPAVSNRSTRNRGTAKTMGSKESEKVQSEVTKSVRETRQRKGSSQTEEEVDTIADPIQPETKSRRGVRNRKAASAEEIAATATDSSKPAASSTRGRRLLKGEETATTELVESVRSSKRVRRREASADSDSSTDVSQEREERSSSVTRGTRSRRTAPSDDTELPKLSRRGKKTSADDEDSVSSTLSLDSVPEGNGGFAQPTPVKGRKGRRAKTPALKVEESSPTITERSSPAKKETSTAKVRGKGTRSTEKLATLEVISTPTRAGVRRNIGRTPQRTPKSSPTPLEAGSPSLRRRSSEPRPKVMFTGVIDKSGEKVVASLGGVLTDSVLECTHLVTDKVRRTVKFLCCLSRGAQIITPAWLEQSKVQQRFVDPADFLLTDKDAEKQYKFSLLKSHERAKEGTLLSGWKIHATPGVKPDPSHMKDIVRSAGGEFLSRVPCQHQENTVVISCEDDAPKCLSAVAADIPIVTAEFLLTGLLRQQIDVDSYRLSVNKTAAAASSTPAKKTTSRSRARRR